MNKKNGTIMSNFKIKFLMCITEVIMQSLVFLSLAIFLAYTLLEYDIHEFGICLVIVVFVMIAYISRKNINNFFIFYLIHFFMFLPAIFAARNGGERFIFIAIVLILIMYSGHIKIGSINVNQERISLVTISIMVINYFFGMVTQNEVLIQSGLLILVVFFLLQMIYHNLNNLNGIFIENRETADFPAQQLYSVNSVMLFATTTMFWFGMMIFYSGPYGNIFQTIGKGILYILKLIFNLIFSGKPYEPREEEMTSMDFTLPPDTESYYDVVPEMPSNIFDALAIFTIIMLAIIVMIALFVIISSALKSFGKKKKYGADVVEFIAPRKKDPRIIRISRRNPSESELELDNNAKLRKIYRRIVKRGKGSEKLPVSTFPEDVTKKTITDDVEEIKIITGIYEKARYSNLSVDLDEIKIMKNVKNLKFNDSIKKSKK